MPLLLLAAYLRSEEHNDVDESVYSVAAACVILGSKIDETPKMPSKIIIEALKMKLRALANGAEVKEVDPGSLEFAEAKEDAFGLERKLLYVRCSSRSQTAFSESLMRSS